MHKDDYGAAPYILVTDSLVDESLIWSIFFLRPVKATERTESCKNAPAYDQAPLHYLSWSVS